MNRQEKRRIEREFAKDPSNNDANKMIDDWKENKNQKSEPSEEITVGRFTFNHSESLSKAVKLDGENIFEQLNEWTDDDENLKFAKELFALAQKSDSGSFNTLFSILEDSLPCNYELCAAVYLIMKRIWIYELQNKDRKAINLRNKLFLEHDGIPSRFIATQMKEQHHDASLEVNLINLGCSVAFVEAVRAINDKK